MIAATAGFPNPIGWAVDEAADLVGGVASAGFDALVGGLVAWATDAVLWVVGGVFGFFIDATDPNVQADWFIGGHGPYATTVAIGAALLGVFVLAGITQGVLAGDIGGMLRRLVVDLPLSVLAMVGLVGATQFAIRLTDDLSGAVLDNFERDLDRFVRTVTSLSVLGGAQATALVLFVLSLVTVLAGLVLIAELSIRAALIYIVVALAPLVFATRLWPATRGAARRCLDLLAALVLSKLAMAVALSVSAAAAVGAGSGGEVTGLATPEVFAQDPGGSITQAVGILLAATAAFGVAAFSPMLVAKLLPLTEAAAVSQGLRGGPARAGQQALYLSNTATASHRYQAIARNQPAVATSAGAGSPPAGAAAAPAAAAGAVWAATRRAQSSAASQSTSPPGTGATSSTSTPGPNQGQGPTGGGDRG